MRLLGPAGFNEAAGNPRGKHVSNVAGYLRAFASMRPRVIPAENGRDVLVHGEGGRRFNEAAGNPRGKPPTAASARLSAAELQ